MTKDKNIFIKNIYYMLSYAFTTLKESVYDDIQKESFDNINNLFADILFKGIGLQLKQGLYKEYINGHCRQTLTRRRSILETCTRFLPM